MKQIPSKNYNIHHHSNMKISICDIVHVIRTAQCLNQQEHQHQNHLLKSNIKWNIHVPDGLYLTYPQLLIDTLLHIQHHTYACNNISIIDIDYYSDSSDKQQYALILTIQHVIDLMSQNSCCHCLCSTTLITTDKYDQTLQLQRRIENVGGAVINCPCLHPGVCCPNCSEVNFTQMNSQTELLHSKNNTITEISELLITKSIFIIPSKFLHRNDFNHNFNSTPIPSLGIEILLVSDSMVIVKMIQKWLYDTPYHITRIPCKDIRSEPIVSSSYHVAIIDFNQVH